MKLFLTVALVLVCACAQEPSTPSDVSLIGSWSSPSVNLFTLSNIKMELKQQDTGIVHGKWTAHSTGGNAGCLVDKPCDGFGNIVGRSTVSRIEIELLGAGKFDGRLVDERTMRGTFALGDKYDTITFARTSLVPAADVNAR